MFSESRHQVFVSSTFTDLVEERRQVMQALLELDCMPAGMELFPASDDDSWTLIKQVIDESDYYIVIVGGRYGSVHDRTGISYTRMEYEYAVEQGKPVMGFLHADPGSLPVTRSEKTEKAQQDLGEFRDLVSQKQCKFWKTPEDLGAVVSRGLIWLRKSKPQPGWVRADSHGDVALRERIIELEAEVTALRAKSVQHSALGAQVLEGGEESVTLEVEFSDRRDELVTTWNDVLLHMTPFTLDAVDQDRMGVYLGDVLARRDDGDIRAGEARLSVESATRIIVFMIATGVLERRGYEYRLTERGIALAAGLQLGRRA